MAGRSSFGAFFLTSLIVARVVVAATTATSQPAIDPREAAAVFELAKSLSDHDAGALWGRRLYGPMLLVDSATRQAVANQKDAQGKLAPRQDQPGCFIGTIPDTIGVANTATNFAGVKWTMVMWPIVEAPSARGRLLMHELYHRIQDDLGLPAANPSNNQLDTHDGRLFLRLEWRALAAALLAERDDQRLQAIRDALLFRRHRQSLFPSAHDTECALEVNEGLAEYTGYRLCGLPGWAVRDRVVVRLGEQEQQSTYVRNFAYASGPAYGLLLDDANPNWRRELKPTSDLSAKLATALKLEVPAQSDELRSAAMQATSRYRGQQLMKLEDEHAAMREKRLADTRRRFFDSPVLIVPLSRQVSYTYDPNGVFAVDDASSIYHTCHIVDEFGRLDVQDDALIVRRDGVVAEARLAAPKPTTMPSLLQGDGWTLRLNEGWRLAAGPRPEDLIVQRDGR
jgi:hypothetical protein